MPDTVRVRVTDGDVWIDGEHHTRGDEVDVPAGVYDRIPGSFERVGSADEAESADDTDDAPDAGDGDESDADDGSVAIDDLDPHPDDLTVDDLEERVADVDDVALLETILEAERADGSPRTTAVDAIEDRIDELEG